MNSVAVITEETGAVSKNERLTQLNRTILETEAKLSGFRKVYKDTHPDVRNFVAQVTVLRRERDQLEKQEELSDKSRPKKATSPLALRQIENLKLRSPM